MTVPTARRLAFVVLSPAAALAVAIVLGLPDAALAQSSHTNHPVGPSLSRGELLGGLAHGATLASVTLLAGLAAFVPAVWLPARREAGGAGPDGAKLFVRLGWALFGVLLVAGIVEVSLYVVRASGEPFSLGLFRQALSETRVGGIWIARLGFSLPVALILTRAARKGDGAYWWLAAAALGTVPLLTLTLLSHAAAEGRFLPFFADWAHVVAASAWMGGLLGFAALLLGPLRRASAEERRRLLAQAVPRFSRVAIASVLVLLVTGAYASLLHVPSFAALIGTPYGRALFMKLGLIAIVLSAGAMNLLDRGKNEAFGRTVGFELALAFGVFVATGFLTSLTPP